MVVAERPRIADLFCGAGGAGMGLHRAGFEVVGFDIAPQPRYPFEFHQADALDVDLSGFDAVWASPPCQGYSMMQNLPWLRGKEYPLLILPTMEKLEASGKPFIIENVMGARKGAKGLKKRGLEARGLEAGYLCGLMFGLPMYRHRLFASNFLWLARPHPKHEVVIGGQKANQPRRGETFIFAANTGKGLAEWDGEKRLAKDGISQNGVNFRKGYEHVEFAMPTLLTMDDPQRNNRNGQSYPQHQGANWKRVAEAMGIDWMKKSELTQAIPPAYSEFLGRQLIKNVRQVHGRSV